MCSKCLNQQIVYKLLIPATKLKLREPAGFVTECKIPCTCTGLVVKQVGSFPSYLADQRGTIYSIREGIATPMKLQLHRGVKVKIYDRYGHRVNMMVGSLVLEAFVGPPYRDDKLKFKDGNYNNVKLSNIDWISTRDD